MEALGINVGGLIAQLVNFSILVLLLVLFAYKPIVKMLDERSAKIKDSLERAEQLKRESDEAQSAINEQIGEARREGQAIIASANQTGQRMKEEAREAARGGAEIILERARAEIQSERDAAIQELRSQFADLTILAAGRVINKALDKEAHRDLIRQTLEEAGSRN